MDEGVLRLAVQCAHNALKTPFAAIEYRLVGGAALVLLGSSRQTADIDVLVASEDVRKAKIMLKQDPNFGWTELGNIYFRASEKLFFNVDVVDVTKTGMGEFPSGILPHHTCLAPLALLETPFTGKVLTLRDAGRRARKGRSDGSDAAYIVQLMAEKGLSLGYGHIQGLDEELVADFLESFPDSAENWQKIGCPSK
ncbi:hypothetical protein K402DRAFT_416261 [Aulographum hederae CBS 113979]|uniref:Nucleotidyltransferase n=1 Tax=Aulographum hederae CBS 113979 TaxID=1176131 RepID=A0A6G1HHS0_9PEZI|nr:hypothetical protein K402DRAFT_416261 [Aulographum hederae CBS 113979]